MTTSDATQQQILASKPDTSTWLSANAGSGKTKVLTDRVARENSVPYIHKGRSKRNAK
jgi:ATP-dependent exoDNAse (exonuclease V) beta subunit